MHWIGGGQPILKSKSFLPPVMRGVCDSQQASDVVPNMYRSHDDLPELSLDEACDLLKVHGMTLEDPTDERLENSLLLSFRAWYDQPRWNSFHDVMSCIKALGPAWSSNDLIHRGPVSDLWGILSLGYSYVRDPNKKTHRMEKPSLQPDMSVEEWWLECIGYAVGIYLQFDDAEEAFTPYNDLMKQCMHHSA
jgi:hypothetical protein